MADSVPSKIYAIGDVHGCADELKALLHRLELDQDSTIIFLGDYVDRGPDSKAVIDTIIDLSQIYRVITLEGNHEWLFTRYLDSPNDPTASSNFILNGGGATLASYSTDGSSYTIPAAHREFLKNLKVWHMTETHLFVHAGIPPDFNFTFPIDAKTAHQFRWIREIFLNSKIQWPRVVVHGHTPVKEPEIHANRINLDTGCVFGKKLTAIDLTAGTFTSVARNEAAEPKFLTSTFQGNTRAKRFSGEVPVEIMADNLAYPFTTLNFNEFGLLIVPAPDALGLQFTMGQKITGTIKPGTSFHFAFEGTLVRIDAMNGKPCFGIKFDHLRELSVLT